MQRRVGLIFTVLFMIAAVSAANKLFAGELITSYYYERYPYYYNEGGEIKGLVASAADYALKKSGLQYKWEPAPPLRQLSYLKENNSRIVIIGWFKNPEREQFGKFSIPVYRDKPYVVLFKKGNDAVGNIKSFNSLLSDRSLKILVKEGYSYGEYIDVLLKKLQPVSEKTTADVTQMVMMLNAGRADYMFASAEEAGFIIESAGLKSSDISIRQFPELPDGEKRYLMFSKMVSDEEIGKINRYLREYLSRK